MKMAVVFNLTKAAHPEDDPPVIRVWSRGCSTGPVADVKLPPLLQRFSQTALPDMHPPESNIRVTTVASTSGIYPSKTREPHIIGIPATQTLSLMAIVFPWSLPFGAPVMLQRQYLEKYK